MDRDTLINAVKEGPVTVYMNDGSSHEIPAIEFCTADHTTAYVVSRNEAGEYKARWLALVCMTRTEPGIAAN